MTTTQALTKIDINQIMAMTKQANLNIGEPYLDEGTWIFELKSLEEAQRALSAVTESQENPRLGLLGLAGICMESNSPEPTSGSASGTNRAIHKRLQ